MNIYRPDNWVVFKMSAPDDSCTCYKVLGGWSGGYLGGDSWRMNSGIVSVEQKGETYEFHGSSGSCYICYKDSNVIRMNIAPTIDMLTHRFGDRALVMDKNTDYMNIDWIIL
jgi:hypothetical protein